MTARVKICGFIALAFAMAAATVAAEPAPPPVAKVPASRPVEKRAGPLPVQRPMLRAAPRTAPAPGPVRPLSSAKTTPTGLGGGAIKMNRGASNIGGKSFAAPMPSLNGTSLKTWGKP
jgi:hypothetical protein